MNKLIIPMYSMRSHKSGKYHLLYDSNTNIVLHMLSMYTGSDTITITIPRNCDEGQLGTLFELTRYYSCKVRLLFIDYGIHAGDTRDCLDSAIDNIDLTMYDSVECHVESVKPRDNPLVWNYVIFNSSIISEERPYADKHFTKILRLLDGGYHVNVSTQGQLDMIPTPLDFSASIYTKFFNPTIFDIQYNKFHNNKIYAILDVLVPKDSIFFPFRISDKCYNFEAVLASGNTVVVTDPNESLVENINVLDIGNVCECKKTILINMFHLMKTRHDIKVHLYEDITKNYHISIVEMMYIVPDSIQFKYDRNILISNISPNYIL